VPGKNGWEIGVYGHDVTEAGKYWWTGDVTGQGGNERVVSNLMYDTDLSLFSKWCVLVSQL